jgi:two-component system CheB/CheR fusion protein
METAKEELQSSNEELTTLNEELEMRNRELAEANDDLINLLASVDIPIVMLDIGLRIRRFNPGAQRILGVLPADIGRQLGDLKTSLQASDLDQRIRTVIDTLVTHEEEVRDRAGRLFSLRIRPYKTADNRIEGVVIALVDIDQIRRAPGG